MPLEKLPAAAKAVFDVSAVAIEDEIVGSTPLMPHYKAGTLRLLAQTTKARAPSLPEVPTYGEMGFPNVYSGSWVGFFAPARTPDAIVAKLNGAINQSLKDPAVQDRLKAIGFDPMFKTAHEAEAYFKSEVASWAKMVNAVGFSN